MAQGQGLPLSPAGSALGLGDLLAGQVAHETDELRRRRLAMAGANPTDIGSRAMLASPVSAALGGMLR